MKKIRTVMVEPRKEPCIKWLDLSITAFNEAVSKGCGFPCHAKAKKLSKGIYILYAEEGTTLMSAANRKIGKYIIFGVFHIINVKNGLIKSLSEEQVETYIARFKKPDEFTEDEVLHYCLEHVCKEIDELQFEEL